MRPILYLTVVAIVAAASSVHADPISDLRQKIRNAVEKPRQIVRQVGREVRAEVDSGVRAVDEFVEALDEDGRVIPRARAYEGPSEYNFGGRELPDSLPQIPPAEPTAPETDPAPRAKTITGADWRRHPSEWSQTQWDLLYAHREALRQKGLIDSEPQLIGNAPNEGAGQSPATPNDSPQPADDPATPAETEGDPEIASRIEAMRREQAEIDRLLALRDSAGAPPPDPFPDPNQGEDADSEAIADSTTGIEIEDEAQPEGDLESPNNPDAQPGPSTEIGQTESAVDADPRTGAAIPTAEAVPDSEGMVFSPFQAGRKVDVRGMPAGSLARDPYTKDLFRVP